MGKSRKVNFGVVAAIAVLVLLGWLVVSNLNSGDLAGEAVGTLDSGSILIKYAGIYSMIDFSVDPPTYTIGGTLAGHDLKVTRVTSGMKVYVNSPAVLRNLYGSQSYDSVSYEICASGAGTLHSSGTIIGNNFVGCLYDAFSGKYIKLVTTGNGYINYKYLSPPPVCGDGVVEGSEQCDDGTSNGQPNKCNTACSGITTPVCSNGVIEAGEQCYDGNTVNEDACTNACRTPTCSDGIKNKQASAYKAESDVDCGFPAHTGCSTACILGKTCDIDVDCQSYACDVQKTCVSPSLTMNNAVIEGNQLKIQLTKSFESTTVHLGSTWPNALTSISCYAPYPCTATIALPSWATAGSTLHGWHGNDGNVRSSVVVMSTATCTDGIKNQDETGIDCGGVCGACAITFNLPVETSTATYRVLDFSANPTVYDHSIATDDVAVGDNDAADRNFAIIDRRSDWLSSLAVVNKQFAQVTASDCNSAFVSTPISRGQLISGTTYCIIPADVGSTKVYKLSLKEATSTDWVIQYQEINTGSPLECITTGATIQVSRGTTTLGTFTDEACKDYVCAQENVGLVANGQVVGQYTIC